MRRIEGLENLPASSGPTVVTVGKFFAVHLGHQALIRATVAAARRRGATSLVLTFDRHPQEILRPGTTFPLLTSLDERLALIEREGPDACVVVRLDAEFLSLSPEAFVADVLVRRLGAVEVVASEGFRFGSGAAGTLATLRELGADRGVAVTTIEPVLVRGERVSTSRVAACVREGEVAAAMALLGRPYSLPGAVVAGDSRGRELGFPTANLEVAPWRLLPGDGVYQGWAAWEDERHPAAINLGVRPTIGGTRRLLEAHLLDFEGDLYGRSLNLEFHHRLRPEQRFPSLDALKQQIARDVAAARALSGGKGEE